MPVLGAKLGKFSFANNSKNLDRLSNPADDLTNELKTLQTPTNSIK
jgi:hypothetical protein